MSVWLDKTGRRSDGQLCDRNSKNIAEKERRSKSRIRTVLPCHPDGRTFAASNFHIKASSVQTRRIVVRTVDLMHAIFNIWYTHARPDHDDWCPDSCSNLPISVFWKEILKLDRTLRVVRTGCWIVRMDTSWSNSKLLDTEDGLDGNPRHLDGWCFSLMCVRMVWHIVWTTSALDNWASGRYDTSSGQLAGNQIFWLANCAESSRNTSE